MTDEIDYINMREEQEQKVALSNRKKAAEQRLEDKTDECVECNEQIPEARQIAVGGTDMCVSCAEIEYLKEGR